MDNSQKLQEWRKQNRLEQLGTNNFVCVASGWTDPCTAEYHHIAGRKFDTHCEYFTASIHRQLSEMQRSHPKQIGSPPSAAESAAHYSFGVADIFILVAHMAEEYGCKLLDAADSIKSADSEARDLTRKVGHYLNMLAAILGRIGERLRHHGDNLIEEERKRAQSSQSPRR
jgi:hypothetical protein